MSTCWLLLINAIVGYQLMDDGTPLSMALTVSSELVIFVGVAYVAVDTGVNYSGEFAVTDPSELKNYALYVLYLLFPLLLVVAFFILESVLVLHVLNETRPMGEHPPPRPCDACSRQPSSAFDIRSAVCHQSDLQLCHQRTPVQGHRRQDRRLAV